MRGVTPFQASLESYCVGSRRLCRLSKKCLKRVVSESLMFGLTRASRYHTHCFYAFLSGDHIQLSIATVYH